MRIVAGKFRGARIEAPKGLATRPTSDRVRQALFNVLEHGAPALRFRGRPRARPVRRLRRAWARSLVAGRALLPVRRGCGGGAGRHPPQCRGAGADRRHQDLAPRRDQARRARGDLPFRSRFPRPALRTRARGASARRLGGRAAGAQTTPSWCWRSAPMRRSLCPRRSRRSTPAPMATPRSSWPEQP